MTKSTCTPRRKALAKRFKSGDLSDSLINRLIPRVQEDEGGLLDDPNPEEEGYRTHPRWQWKAGDAAKPAEPEGPWQWRERFAKRRQRPAEPAAAAPPALPGEQSVAGSRRKISLEIDEIMRQIAVEQDPQRKRDLQNQAMRLMASESRNPVSRLIPTISEHCGFCPEDMPGDETVTQCPSCGGPGVFLGQLGNRVHFRCRNCGMDFSGEHEGDVLDQD